jgi:AcrR family transcriptional regulator
MRQIAAEGGVSTGTINHYFANKQEALLAALLAVAHDWDAKIRQALEAETDPWQRLVRFVEQNIPNTPEMVQNWCIWLEFWAQSSRRADLKKVHERFSRQWREAVRQVIREGIESGQFRPCDPDIVATTVVAMIDGAGVECILDDPGMKAEQMYRLCVDYLRLVLGKDDSSLVRTPALHCNGHTRSFSQ